MLDLILWVLNCPVLLPECWLVLVLCYQRVSEVVLHAISDEDNSVVTHELKWKGTQPQSYSGHDLL